VPALTDVERLRFPAPYGELEAFHTSGGVSTLTRTLAGRARNLDYKTIRYPGHCQKMKLLFDLGLASSEPLEVGASAVSPREVLARLLERRLTVGPEEEDVVLVLIEADGKVDGRTVRKGLRIIDLADPQHQLSAMMRTTGFPAAIIAAMLAGGQIERRGALAQELVVPGEPFLAELERRRIQIERFENEVV
jgi:lysine 6-dehydrogenase